MKINADFASRVVDLPSATSFVSSPAAGVLRRMLDRIGDEVARATSVVRYAPGSRFPRHVHEQGEEFLVLEGSFEDEHGRYGPGVYVRNPPGSAHAPWSTSGCTLFVKLRQFAPDDLERVVVDSGRARWHPGLRPGLSVLPLHAHGTEQVALVRWAPGTRFDTHTHVGGEEIYVLEGTFCDEFGDYPAGSWLRNPHLSSHTPFSRDGALIYVKVGHL